MQHALPYTQPAMAVIICMLRGVNSLGHNVIKMDALKALFVSLKLKDPRTFLQSGNVIFRVGEVKSGEVKTSELKPNEEDLAKLARRIQNAIEKKFACRPDVILRTASELRETFERNPFAKRRGIQPSHLLVVFLPAEPGREAHDETLALKIAPEELHIICREAYIYFRDGQGRSKLRLPTIERALKMSGTGRNWNSVTKMLAIAESMETAK
jgi:uncharacterized protein (DUF1697 family)